MYHDLIHPDHYRGPPDERMHTMAEHIDKTGECAKCHGRIEHVAGIRDPYWRHVRPASHAAVPKR